MTDLFDAPPAGGDVYPPARPRVFVFTTEEHDALLDALAAMATGARVLTAEPKGSKRSAELCDALGVLLGGLARQFDIDEVLLADRITRQWEHWKQVRS